MICSETFQHEVLSMRILLLFFLCSFLHQNQNFKSGLQLLNAPFSECQTWEPVVLIFRKCCTSSICHWFECQQWYPAGTIRITVFHSEKLWNSKSDDCFLELVAWVFLTIEYYLIDLYSIEVYETSCFIPITIENISSEELPSFHEPGNSWYFFLNWLAVPLSGPSYNCLCRNLILIKQEMRM